jgi:hypothetical protein
MVSPKEISLSVHLFLQHKIMNTISRIIQAGILHEDGDTWLLVTPTKLLFVDIPFFPDLSLIKQPVTILGTMGVPAGSPFEKLIAEKIITHKSIAERAYEMHLGNHNASAEGNWFAAENELAGL